LKGFEALVLARHGKPSPLSTFVLAFVAGLPFGAPNVRNLLVVRAVYRAKNRKKPVQ
jgi:hypothetical protein